MAREILYGNTKNLERTINFIQTALSGRYQVIQYLRNELINQGQIKQIRSSQSRLQVVEGVDGSYKPHKTLAFQVLAFGVVGYAPSHPDPSKRLRHFVMAVPTLMSDFSSVILKGITTLYEFAMAYTSTSDLVIMDGSFISFLTSLNSFYAKVSNNPNDPAVIAIRRFIDPNINDPNNVYQFAGSKKFLIGVLTSKKVIAVPKGSGTSSALQYILDKVVVLNNPPVVGNQSFKDHLLSHYTDRMLFTLILQQPGEYFRYYVNQRDLTNGHEANLARSAGALRPEDADDVEAFYDDKGVYAGIGGFTYVFYRPHRWSPAYKIEIPGRASDSFIEEILIRLSQSVLDPSIAEHYEQYMADRLAKIVAKSTRAIIGASINSLSNTLGPEIVRILLSSYRTER